MKTIFICLKAAFVLVLLLGAGACAPKTVSFARSKLMMGHVPVSVILRTTADLREKALEATEKAYEIAEKIERKISEYQPNSEISCLNQNAGKRSCTISQETYEILNQSLEMTQKTESAFDIRFASLSNAGRVAPILLQPHRARLTHSDARIGVAAIGKGYILDAMLQMLKKQGFQQALIDGGGDIQASGGPWKVAIQVPGRSPHELSRKFEINDQALATSGNYEQAGNVRDPRTLEKVVRSSSVSVIAPTLTLANALTTAFYVMGEKMSLSYLSKFPGIQLFWADPDGKVRHYVSPQNEK